MDDLITELYKLIAPIEKGTTGFSSLAYSEKVTA